MKISKLSEMAHSNARDKGFWDDFDIILKMIHNEDFDADEVEAVKQAFFCQKLILIISEICEGVEGLRKFDYENFEEEIADTFIRLGDFTGGLNIDIEQEVEQKMKVNQERPPKHGKGF